MFQASQQIGYYTLLRKLGEGGFGEVWLAENRSDSPSEKVAIKLPRKDQIDLQAVKDEIFNWILSGKHKNILPIIECETFGNQIAIVSEYAPAGSLQDSINKKGSLPIDEAVEITIGILDGLAHLHNRKIIHRDLKPDNVLFQGNVPRLTDFGISRAMTVSSQSQTVSGTLSYMAPEAFDGKRNAQTDIWAVGVILYQLLTGNLPFPQKGMIELVGALARREPAPLPASIPSDLQTIVKKALEKELSDRYQTADEMAKELREFSQKNSEETLKIPSYEIPPTESSPKIDEYVTDKSDSVVTDVKISFETNETETTIRPVSLPTESKTNPLFFAVSAGVLLLLAVGGVGYWMASQKTETPHIPIVSTVGERWLIPFRKGDKFGFSDITKNLVIVAKYDDVEPFNDGLARVKLNEEWGYIDKAGKEITPLKYDVAGKFSEGLACVIVADNQTYNSKYGFIDKTGKEIIPLKYDSKVAPGICPSSFKEGLAVVNLNDKYGFIDKTGKQIIPPKYDYARSFEEGLAMVELNDKRGFIDKTGKEVIPLEYEDAYFREGLANVKLNGREGFIDKMGNEVIKLKYQSAIPFSEGLASVELNGKWGYIDKTGIEVIPLKYDFAYSFQEGMASVTLNGKEGFIDRTGKEVIPIKYDDLDEFREGLARAKQGYLGYYQKWGYLDKTGKEVISFKYDLTFGFSDELAEVQLNGKRFYIDKNGTEYYEP